MYQLFQVDGVSGMFTPIHQSDNVNDCLDKKESLSSSSYKLVVLFDFEKSKAMPEDQETKIILNLIEQNKGELIRVTKGVTISKNKDAVCCGTGSKCYCVVAGGERYCETYHCNANGYCWVTRCGVPCGC